ncbi:hypothetical protein PENSPDRAFT_694822 [Peniophora sp. CONT]|nr:hypothetical protein PENSPDRAFT_694822 [Peniophora sp. CONT]
MLLTLPIGIVTIVINVVGGLTPVRYLRFYSGWTFLHTDWEPAEVPYSLLENAGRFQVAQFYFNFWAPPVLAFTVFAFFGVTAEARASYWRILCTIGQWFGWEPTLESEKQRMSLGIIEFGEGPQDISIDAEMGSYPSSVTAEKYGIERVDI